MEFFQAEFGNVGVADLGLVVRLIDEASARKNHRDAQRVANRRNQ